MDGNTWQKGDWVVSYEPRIFTLTVGNIDEGSRRKRDAEDKPARGQAGKKPPRAR